MEPVYSASDEQFAKLRSALVDAGYDLSAMCARAGANRVDHILTSPSRRESVPPLEDRLDALMWLLLEGRIVPEGAVRSLLPPGLLESLAELGLVLQTADGFQCPLGLYPAEGLFVLSDRWNDTVDSVYPTFAENSMRFLDVIPRRKCGTFLDLCTGTGVAALVAGRDFADSAAGCDIGRRATRFAEFNRCLNGIPNVSFAQGNLYEPYAGRTFDCIVSHPPHVPVLKPKYLFSDGGGDGEQVGRQIVGQLAQYLAPDGQLCLLSMGADTKDAPFEQRARQWLGESQAEFDVALVARQLMDPVDFISESVMRGTTEVAEAGPWKAQFRSRGVTHFVYGTLLIVRKTESRAPFTVRRRSTEKAHRRKEMDWLLQWERATAGGTAAKLALQSKLTAAPGTLLHVSNHLEKGSWTAGEYRLETDYPFKVQCRTQPWIAHLLGLCNGKKTGVECLRDLTAAGMVAPGTSPEQFAQALIVLISEGFLQLASGSNMINSI